MTKKCTRFLSSSGGNAGMAVAYSGRMLNVPVTVVIPETTSPKIVDLIRQEGAEVVIHGKVWDDANQLALKMCSENESYTFIHPFDDPMLWEGISTIVDEVVEEMPKPDVIVTVVGGGSLLSGLCQGLEKHGWQDVPIMASETKGADSFNTSVIAKKLVTLDAITSIAKTLGAKRVCQQVFDCSQKYPITSVVVTDETALRACKNFANDTRYLVEVSCGAGLAVIYEKLPELMEILKDKKEPIILMMICGGNAMTLDDLKNV
jgi:L-serine/L-threonine ammonia-lyase